MKRMNEKKCKEERECERDRRERNTHGHADALITIANFESTCAEIDSQTLL